MAARRKNGIWYEGRIINTNGQAKLAESRNGKIVLDLVIAEQFQEKNSQAPEEFRSPTAAPDDYVNTYTAWHRLRAFGSKDNEALRGLVTNPLFNHGCVVVVDATYREEAPWEDRGGKIHAGRREQIFFDGEDGGTIEIKVLDDGRVLGAREDQQGRNWAVPLWDGVSKLPSLGGTGGPSAPQYDENEGF